MWLLRRLRWLVTGFLFPRIAIKFKVKLIVWLKLSLSFIFQHRGGNNHLPVWVYHGQGSFNQPLVFLCLRVVTLLRREYKLPNSNCWVFSRLPFLVSMAFFTMSQMQITSFAFCLPLSKCARLCVRQQPFLLRSAGWWSVVAARPRKSIDLKRTYFRFYLCGGTSNMI